MRDYEINSDLKQSKFENLKFVQGDTGSKIIVNLFEDSQTVNLTDCTVLARYKRSDGYADNKEASIEDNTITVEVDETMTATAGVLKLIFEITYETTKKVSTFMLLADISEGISKSTTGGGTGDVVVDVDLSNYYNKQEIDKKLDNIANELGRNEDNTEIDMGTIATTIRGAIKELKDNQENNTGSGGLDLSSLTITTESVDEGTNLILTDGTTTKNVTIPSATESQVKTVVDGLISDGTLSALTIEDNSIGKEKLSFPVIEARKSTNLFNKTTATLHCRILQNGGIQSFTEGNVYYNTWFTSDYIDITGNNGYIIANGWHSYCLYDENKTLLSGYCPDVNTNSNDAIEVDTTVKYIKISGWLSKIDLFKVNLGNILLKYENYEDVFIPNNSVSNDCLSEKITLDNIDTSNLVMINTANNLIDFSTIKIDYNIDISTGEEVEISSGYYYAITDFIKVKSNTSYNINCGGIYFYDKNKKYLGYRNGILKIIDITTPAECNYIKLQIGSPTNGANIKLPYYIVEGEKPFIIEQKDEYIDENLIKENVLYKSVLYRMRKLFNPLIKTTISLLGDSNTAGLETGQTGVYLENCWANLLKNHIETKFGVDVYLPVYSKYVSAIGAYYEGSCWFNKDTGFVNLKFYGSICKIHYIGCSSSIMTITVDGGTPVEVDTSTTGIYEISDLTEEYHTLEISTKDTNKIRISGITIHKYVTVSNDGISGTSTSSLPSTFDKDIAIITYGTNSRSDTSLSTMKMQFEDFIKKQNDKGIDVILVSPTPATDGFEIGTTNGFNMSDIDSAIAQVCAKLNIEYISLYQYILDYCDFTGTDLNSMLKDTLHITEATHYIVFKYLCNKLGLGRPITGYLPTT